MEVEAYEMVKTFTILYNKQSNRFRLLSEIPRSGNIKKGPISTWEIRWEKIPGKINEYSRNDDDWFKFIREVFIDPDIPKGKIIDFLKSQFMIEIPDTFPFERIG